MPDRIKLIVTSVDEPKKINEQGLQKLSFKATLSGGPELSYFTFSPKFFPLIKSGPLDCDVTTEVKGEYTNRKVTMVYEGGQPVGGQQRQGGGNWQARPDNSASIEMQTAAKIGGELLVAKIVLPGDPLGQATIAWCMTRLGTKQTRPAEAKAGDPAKEPDDFDKTFGKPATVNAAPPIFANAGAFMSRAHAEYQLTATQVYSRMAVSKLINEGRLTEAWVELEKLVKAAK
jgi:hypothetical protein